MACPRGCITTLVAFVWLFSTVLFHMCPQTVCTRACIFALVAFVWLFTTVFCVFSNVSSKRLHRRMHNHTGCICLTFLHCGFSNVSSNRLSDMMQNHTGCICLSFLYYVISNDLHFWMYTCIGCTFLTSHLVHYLPHSYKLQHLHSLQPTQDVQGFYPPFFLSERTG